MAITNGYATLADLKAYLTPANQTFSTSVADDAVLELLIEGASRFIDGETCRKFYKNSVTETRYFEAKDNEIKTGDLVSITTLDTDDGNRTYSYSWAATDYDLYPSNAVLDGIPYYKIVLSPITTQVMPNGVSKGVKISGIFGWPAVPTGIKESTIMIAASASKRRFGETLSQISTITAGGVVITPQDVPAVAWAKINPFRKRI